MKPFLSLICFAFTIQLASCDGNLQQENQQTTVLPNTFNPNTVTTTDSASNKSFLPAATLPQLTSLNPAHGQPGHRCDIPEGSPLPSALPTTANDITSINNNVNNSNNKAGLNPEHGQPGHRCDLAVGEPLVDTAKKSSAIPANTTKTVAPGMNPSHGQPGHRCDLAVGAPLSDTAKKKTAVAANTANTVNTPAPAKVAQGMNPSHGQPGHRCDIAVGSPLSDTAKKNKTVQTTPVIPEAAKSVAQNFQVKPTATASVVPGTNPKHGQPGHRCDLAVGAPLSDTVKSKTIKQ